MPKGTIKFLPPISTLDWHEAHVDGHIEGLRAPFPHPERRHPHYD
jgi:hypothetical protein